MINLITCVLKRVNVNLFGIFSFTFSFKKYMKREIQSKLNHLSDTKNNLECFSPMKFNTNLQ